MSSHDGEFAMPTITRSWLPALACLLALAAPGFSDHVPVLQFNEVKEIAPGVFFRYSAIGPEGSKVVFGGSNNIWIVFDDYVAVFDANFPSGARDVIAAIRKTTDKPIRYVVDSHHHGDHAYGNAVFAKEGASIVAQANCARSLRIDGPEEFRKAGIGPNGRKDVLESSLKVPSVVFDDKLVLDDGNQRVEFLFLGHAHTAGDAFAYLPRHKILCTGDACVNGAYNYMGHSDSLSWIRVLEKAQQFDVKLICPGHGPLADKDLLERQKRYFVELRKQVRQGIEGGKTLDEIKQSINLPWYKEWTTVTPAEPNIEHVYNELTGRTMPWDLKEDYGVLEGPSPTRSTPGWEKPRRIVIPNLMPARLAELKRLAPDIEFVPARTVEDAVKEAADADAVLGFCTPDVVKAGARLRWIQVGHAGVEKDLSDELKSSRIVLTNTERIDGPPAADQAFALLLALTRNLAHGLHVRAGNNLPGAWARLRDGVNPEELHGKTMLVVGLGGLGTQISRRAHAFDMRVRAIEPKEMDRPDFVFSLDKPSKLPELLPEADVVVLACPLTPETKGLLGKKQFDSMKKSALLINVARGGIVETDALVSALKGGTIAGAGLDVTDPEPLPDEHPLWKLPNVVISPHLGNLSVDGVERQWRLFRENVRRFVAGEPLLCVVDKEKGY
jgi:phosphoglycerate dehydrogenase-like enzyme/glyoxylase-like metal-dependent hydrolase (beta-lactamase superfamily II)